MLDWARVKLRANNDGEFIIHARMWNSVIRLNHGRSKTRIDVANGSITDIAPWRGGGPADLSISAPETDWQSLLAKVPKPFYQDLYPASLHHEFEINGNSENYCAYYPAIRRLVEILREVNNG